MWCELFTISRHLIDWTINCENKRQIIKQWNQSLAAPPSSTTVLHPAAFNTHLYQMCIIPQLEIVPNICSIYSFSIAFAKNYSGQDVLGNYWAFNKKQNETIWFVACSQDLLWKGANGAEAVSHNNWNNALLVLCLRFFSRDLLIVK